MIRVDVAKVRGKMAEKGYNITTLSAKIGVNRNTLSNYLDDPSKIPYSILSAMASVLCDGPDEATSIFFADDLRRT